ncbi:hypothetical protein CRE_14789 [Caenorhabditis remanei]|uniref:Uncharacterized protein n=1 Tax=Caenorhabditis remanei TaxID=31234 RepID=E3MRQ5_CAERE|nr:hypothetical protein CRE_14789 [Caenorhabditis remanei]
MSGRASTSTGAIIERESLQTLIAGIKARMRAPSGCLKKLAQPDSVSFLTTSDVTLPGMCFFYLGQKLLDPSAMTDEGREIREEIEKVLNSVNASEALSQIRTKMTEKKKLCDETVRSLQDLVIKFRTIERDAELAAKRVDKVGARYNESFIECSRQIRSIQRRGETVLEIIGICQKYATVDEEKQLENVGHVTCVARREIVEQAMMQARNALIGIHNICAKFMERARVGEIEIDPAPELCIKDLMQDLEALKKKIKKFEIKTTSYDEQGAHMQRSFRHYVRDLRILVPYYIECTKAYKVGYEELMRLHSKLSVVCIRLDKQCKLDKTANEQFKLHDETLLEIENDIRQADRVIRENFPSQTENYVSF